MPLVYFITGLPRLERRGPPPIDRATFIARARADLSAGHLSELERLLRIEEVEAGVRIQADALLANPSTTGDELSRLMYDREPATEGGQPVAELPEWMHRPRPLRAQLRRFWHDTLDEARSDFLRAWSDYIVNLWEVITGLLSKRADLPRDDFIRQMSGSFDTTALHVIRNYDQADAGLRDRFPWVSDVIAALDDPDMQAGERAINDLQWQAIDRFADIEPFSIDTVLAYYLRLRILEREACWQQERGNAVLDAALAEAADMMATAWETA